MGRACAALGHHLGLHHQWGADFVLDGKGEPVMVDLNMGRPNGSLSYYCWRARQPPPTMAMSGAAAGNAGSPITTHVTTLALAATTYEIPTGLRLSILAKSLFHKGLLWDSTRGDGIVLAQYLPGIQGGGTVLSASWEGPDAVRRILDAFRAHMRRVLCTDMLR